jgi:hypothetical protein
MRHPLSPMCLRLVITCGILAVCASCTPQLNLGPRTETKIIHERLGQPSTVAQDDPIEVTTTGADGKPVNGKIRADGMMLLDRPTYEMYHAAGVQSKAEAKK